MTEKEVKAAQQLGRDSWLAGFRRDDNPYQGKGIVLWGAWYHGWSEARDEYNGGKRVWTGVICLRP